MERNGGSRRAAWAATAMAAVMLTWGALQVVQGPAGADPASGARAGGSTATGEPGLPASSDGDIVPTTDASSPVSRGGLAPSDPVPTAPSDPVPPVPSDPVPPVPSGPAPTAPGDPVPPVPGESVPGRAVPGASDPEPASSAGRTASVAARASAPERPGASRPAAGERPRRIGHQVRLPRSRSAQEARRLVRLRHRAAWIQGHRAVSVHRRGVSRR